MRKEEGKEEKGQLWSLKGRGKAGEENITVGTDFKGR